MDFSPPITPIGAFFSLARAFVPHSFKSKDALSGGDRDSALAWLTVGELSLEKKNGCLSRGDYMRNHKV